MSIKTLTAGLSVCTLFLLSSWQPGIAKTSFTPEIDTDRTFIAAQNPLWKPQEKSDYELNGDLPNLLLASQRSPSFRTNHTRKPSRRNHPSSFKTNRQNDSRFFQRSRRSNFSSPNSRSYSNRGKSPAKRSALGANNIRDSVNTYKRSKSRKYEYITPR